MSKDQTYVTIYYDENNNSTNFERWNCEKIATVYKNTRWLFNNELYRKNNLNDGVTVIKCYDYFDGIKGLKPAAVWNIAEVLT